MRRRRKHHLAAEVFEGQNHIVTLTLCTARRVRWLARPAIAAIAREEVLALHDAHPIIGFCIMPDHVHLLMANSGATLGTIVGRFKARTSLQVHRLESDLELWQDDYWDHIVRREEGLYKVLQYILLNPVRAGLVANWWEYGWSGSPLLGDTGPQFFTYASPEDIVWRDLLARGP
jgi:REP element-mobilizing transposase RayT